MFLYEIIPQQRITSNREIMCERPRIHVQYIDLILFYQSESYFSRISRAGYCPISQRHNEYFKRTAGSGKLHSTETWRPGGNLFAGSRMNWPCAVRCREFVQETEWRRQWGMESNGILLPSTFSTAAPNEEFIGRQSKDGWSTSLNWSKDASPAGAICSSINWRSQNL
jgi:hypothetical protein